MPNAAAVTANLHQLIRNGGDGALLLIFSFGSAFYIWPNGLTASLFVFSIGCVGLATQR